MPEGSQVVCGQGNLKNNTQTFKIQKVYSKDNFTLTNVELMRGILIR